MDLKQMHFNCNESMVYEVMAERSYVGEHVSRLSPIHSE